MISRSSRLIMVLVLGLSFWVAACASAPYTGRRQLLLGSETGEISSGLQAYTALRRQYRGCPDPAVNEAVFRVASRIAAAANRPDYHWEFVVLENDREANAFCLPGGKVGIFTGLLKYTRNEADLATVLAHEAAHALARHAGERRSQAMLSQLGGLGLALGLGGVNPAAGQAISQGYGLGTELGILLPYSRTQELEADKIGLILMAKAGYDPALALDFWRRMMTAPEHQRQPPQFLSTHPGDVSRLQAMAEFLPEAETYYRSVAAPPEPMAPPGGFYQAPPAPAQPRPPAAPAPEAAPAPQEPVQPEAPDDLELKPMENQSQAEPAPGQWMPAQK